MADRKALKAQYRQMKPDMGVFVIQSKNTGQFHLEPTSDLKSSINSASFKLNVGNHPNKFLQKAWTAEKESSFRIEVMEKLEYREEDSGQSYGEELSLMRDILESQLVKDGFAPYKK